MRVSFAGQRRAAKPTQKRAAQTGAGFAIQLDSSSIPFSARRSLHRHTAPCINAPHLHVRRCPIRRPIPSWRPTTRSQFASLRGPLLDRKVFRLPTHRHQRYIVEFKMFSMRPPFVFNSSFDYFSTLFVCAEFDSDACAAPGRHGLHAVAARSVCVSPAALVLLCFLLLVLC